jgi:hypothetical protein
VDKLAAEFSAMAECLVKEAWNPKPLLQAGKGAIEFLAPRLRSMATPVAQAAAKQVKGAIPTRAGMAKAYQGWKAEGGASLLAGRVAGSAIGAAGGAGYGAATAQTPEERSSRALGGAMIGGLLGVGGGQFLSEAGRAQAGRVAARQAHGLTGYLPRTKEQIAAGASRFGKGWTPQEREAAMKAMKMHLEGASGEAAKAGLTSLPGVAKELVIHPIQTLKHGVRTGGVLGTGATLAIAGSQVPGVVNAPEGTRGARIGRVVGESVGFTAGMPLPIVGNAVFGSALGRAGETVGRGVDAISRSRRPPPPPVGIPG